MNPNDPIKPDLDVQTAIGFLKKAMERMPKATDAFTEGDTLLSTIQTLAYIHEAALEVVQKANEAMTQAAMQGAFAVESKASNPEISLEQFFSNDMFTGQTLAGMVEPAAQAEQPTSTPDTQPGEPTTTVQAEASASTPESVKVEAVAETPNSATEPKTADPVAQAEVVNLAIESNAHQPATQTEQVPTPAATAQAEQPTSTPDTQPGEPTTTVQAEASASTPESVKVEEPVVVPEAKVETPTTPTPPAAENKANEGFDPQSLKPTPDPVGDKRDTGVPIHESTVAAALLATNNVPTPNGNGKHEGGTPEAASREVVASTGNQKEGEKAEPEKASVTPLSAEVPPKKTPGRSNNNKHRI